MSLCGILDTLMLLIACLYRQNLFMLSLLYQCYRYLIYSHGHHLVFSNRLKIQRKSARNEIVVFLVQRKVKNSSLFTEKHKRHDNKRS